MEEYDINDLSPRESARLTKCAVAPRPIAWISTKSENGNDNLAPFSSYTYVGTDSPFILFNSPHGERESLKDTARNILDTGDFVVNLVTEPNLEKMDHTSKTIPEDESEFDMAEIQRGECRYVSPPRVADAKVAMECNLHDTIVVNETLITIGEVVYVHISEEVLTDGMIDMNKINSVGRLG